MTFIDPMQTPPDATPRNLTVDQLISQLENSKLSTMQVERLGNMLSGDGGDFDIHQEIKLQHSLIKAIRADLLNPDGQLREEASAQQIQSLFNQVNSFMALYMRSMEKLDRDKELAQIEYAIIEAIKTCPKDVQDDYLTNLKKQLAQ